MIKAPIKNLYEATIITKPNLSDESLEKIITQIESAITNYGGTIAKTDDPLFRKFIHKIKGFKDGFYVTILFNSTPELPNTLKRTISMMDDVLRHIIIGKED